MKDANPLPPTHGTFEDIDRLLDHIADSLEADPIAGVQFPGSRAGKSPRSSSVPAGTLSSPRAYRDQHIHAEQKHAAYGYRTASPYGGDAYAYGNSGAAVSADPYEVPSYNPAYAATWSGRPHQRPEVDARYGGGQPFAAEPQPRIAYGGPYAVAPFGEGRDAHHFAYSYHGPLSRAAPHEPQAMYTAPPVTRSSPAEIPGYHHHRSHKEPMALAQRATNQNASGDGIDERKGAPVADPYTVEAAHHSHSKSTSDSRSNAGLQASAKTMKHSTSTTATAAPSTTALGDFGSQTREPGETTAPPTPSVSRVASANIAYRGPADGGHARHAPRLQPQGVPAQQQQQQQQQQQVQEGRRQAPAVANPATASIPSAEETARLTTAESLHTFRFPAETSADEVVELPRIDFPVHVQAPTPSAKNSAGPGGLRVKRRESTPTAPPPQQHNSATTAAKPVTASTAAAEPAKLTRQQPAAVPQLQPQNFEIEAPLVITVSAEHGNLRGERQSSPGSASSRDQQHPQHQQPAATGASSVRALPALVNGSLHSRRGDSITSFPTSAEPSYGQLELQTPKSVVPTIPSVTSFRSASDNPNPETPLKNGAAAADGSAGGRKAAVVRALLQRTVARPTPLHPTAERGDQLAHEDSTFSPDHAKGAKLADTQKVPRDNEPSAASQKAAQASPLPPADLPLVNFVDTNAGQVVPSLDRRKSHQFIKEVEKGFFSKPLHDTDDLQYDSARPDSANEAVMTEITVCRAIERRENRRQTDVTLRRKAMNVNATTITIDETIAEAEIAAKKRTPLIVALVVIVTLIIIGAVVGILIWQKVIKT
jgi:hypothetical protein